MKADFCSMCGALDGDAWQTQRTMSAALIRRCRQGDTSQTWVICDECNEGLKNVASSKPDQVWLLSQVRRATIDDQKGVLDWLLKKFAGSK